MEPFVYPGGNERHFGPDATSKIGKLAIRYGRKILLVYGQGSIKKIGLYEKVRKELENHKCEIYEICGIRSNPEISTVYKAIEIVKKNKINLILPVGGGSVWDAAKAIAIGACYNGDVWDFFNGKKPTNALPIGGIITIPGTSSESNGIAVLSNDVLKKKRSLHSNMIIPKFAIIDPQLGEYIPYDVFKYSAFDIIAHLLEGYMDKTDTVWDDFSITLIEKMLKIIPQLKYNRTYEILSEIFFIGNIAHEGILYKGRKGGDWACHKIEHSLSAFDPSIYHGQGLAIIFPAWMKLVYKFYPEKFIKLFKKLYNTSNIEKGIIIFKKHLNSIGIETSLKNLIADKEKFINFVLDDLEYYKNIGQIKVLTKDDIKQIIEYSFE